MAERRMFAKKIINSARFLKMPLSSRVLYYDLGMNADDDGIVEAFTVMQMNGTTEDDLRVLVAKQFVTILNQDLVTQIMDWEINNLIRKDRYVESIYKNLKVQVGSPMVNQWLTEDSIGKESKVKNNIYNIPDGIKEEFEAYKQMRKMMKKPMTDYAVRMALKKLNKMSPDINVQKEILNQSVEHSWLGLFPVKDFKQDTLPVYDTSKNKEYSEEYINELLRLRGTNE